MSLTDPNYMNIATSPPHSRTVHLDIIKVLSPTDAQENCFKRSIKIYIKIAPVLM